LRGSPQCQCVNRCRSQGAAATTARFNSTASPFIGDFCNKIGTNAKCNDVRYVAALRA
jgi:hypothetical protein